MVSDTDKASSYPSALDDANNINTSSSIVPIATATSYYGAVTVLHDEETITEVDDYNPLLTINRSSLSPSSSSSSQSLVFRDLPFALLFYLHLAIFLWLGLDLAPKGFDMLSKSLGNLDLNLENVIAEEIRKSDDDSIKISEEQIVQLEHFMTLAFEYLKVYPQRMVWSIAVPSAAFAFVFSFTIAVFLIKPFPRTMVYSCLVESFVLVAAVSMWACWASRSLFLSAITVFFLASTLYYVAIIAWRMVPFAAVNLKVAVEGVASNCGLFGVAFVLILLGILWAVYWLYVVIGVAVYKSHQCQAEHPTSNFDISSEDYDHVCDPHFMVVLLFLLSLYWTTTITMNLIQITVAGVIGTWCYAKEDASFCCSLAIFLSCFRSLTFSFGSVCLGSLLQGFVQLFRFIVEQVRDQRDRIDSTNNTSSCVNNCCCGSFFLCILECLASILEDVIYMFNQYAYIYAGIYGLSYLESGRKVLDLFRARGWTTIITDNLVGYVLIYATFTSGVVSGMVGVLLERWVNEHYGSHHGDDDDHDNEHDSYVFGPLPKPRAWAFTFGFLMGTWVCAIMMNVVKGAVNTILVCWADSPTIFEMNHPTLCREMADSWTLVFPEVHVHVGTLSSSSQAPNVYYYS